MTPEPTIKSDETPIFLTCKNKVELKNNKIPIPSTVLIAIRVPISGAKMQITVAAM